MIERRAILLLAGAVLFAVAAAGGAWLGVAMDDPEDSSVECWDGSRADAANGCPQPDGRAGMASVFPSLGPECEARPSREGKAELFVCVSRGLVIRYSRWDPFVDRIAYFQEANPAAFVATWRPGGTEAGVQWTSREATDSESQSWQWSATYAGFPYSVSVEGATKADRRVGIERVRAVAPEAVGLAPAG